MTVAILDVRPALRPGAELRAKARGNSFYAVRAVRVRPDRRVPFCRWQADRDGRLVCVWQSKLDSPSFLPEMRGPPADVLAFPCPK